MNDVKGARATITRFFASFWGIVIVGAVIGAIASFLQYLGNPPNMGVCVACFTRDIAGAIGLHRLAVAQYIRPEIIGFVFGSLVAALLFHEFKPRGGSAPIARFLLGMFAMVGALVFLGCPWRTLLRLAGGDGNAIIGFAGLVLGVSLGSVCLKRGFPLGRSQPMPAITGWLFPLFMLLLFGLLLFRVSFKEGGAIFFSSKGPGAMTAPILASLGAALVIGFLAQRSRFCTTAAIRNVLLIRDFRILAGLARQGSSPWAWAWRSAPSWDSPHAKQNRGVLMADGVVLFYTVHDMFTLQRELERQDLGVKAIPTPRHLSSDCGTALRFDRKDVETVRKSVDALSMEIQGIHEI
jgi:hypothetical protein